MANAGFINHATWANASLQQTKNKIVHNMFTCIIKSTNSEKSMLDCE
jgi:hypothetical protein